MIPNKLDLTFNRGAAFEMELVSQVKSYNFDPDVHNGPADLKRTHAENLEHYGFTYVYIDFETLYSSAELRVDRSWIRDGQVGGTPLLSLTVGDGLLLGSRSVSIGIEAADTLAMDFDEGVYQLLLTTAAGRVDKLVYGKVLVIGDREAESLEIL